jgi:hypothetical protein
MKIIQALRMVVFVCLMAFIGGIVLGLYNTANAVTLAGPCNPLQTSYNQAFTPGYFYNINGKCVFIDEFHMLAQNQSNTWIKNEWTNIVGNRPSYHGNHTRDR